MVDLVYPTLLRQSCSYIRFYTPSAPLASYRVIVDLAWYINLVATNHINKEECVIHILFCLF